MPVAPTATRSGSFQSSPPPKERCNTQPPLGPRRRRELSILTAPEGAVQSSSTRDRRARTHQSFNPHRPRRDGAMVLLVTLHLLVALLSILTAPEGAVQFPHSDRQTLLPLGSFNPHRPRRSDAIAQSRVGPCQQHLSILTAPEGAVQLLYSSAPGLLPSSFQSSPPPKERCNCMSRSLSSSSHPSFNPHRPRRSGAISRGS